MLKNWMNDDIRKDIDILRKMAEGEDDYFKKNYILQVLNKTEYMLKVEELNQYAPDKSKSQMMYDLNLDYTSYQRYYDLIKVFYNLSKTPELALEVIKESAQSLDLYSTEQSLSDEEAITLVHDFFMNTDKTFSKLFSDFFNDSYSGIKFAKDNSTLEIFDCDGMCTFIDILKRNYIVVKDTNNLYKSVVLSHECGHAVANLFAPETEYNRKDTFLSEVASIFFEVIFNYEIASKVNSFSSALYSAEKFDYMTEVTYSLIFHKKILEEWIKNGYKVDKRYYEILQKNYSCNRLELRDLLNYSIDDEGAYVIGYMIALELLNIYKQDKNEAFRILRLILKKYDKDSLITINSIFKGFYHVKEELEHINNNMNIEIEKVLK